MLVIRFTWAQEAAHPEPLPWGGKAKEAAADLSGVPKGEASVPRSSPRAPATMTAGLPATLFLHCLFKLGS